jgi:DNA helicase-2/ATP-dependent DNA helicase PcrA
VDPTAIVEGLDPAQERAVTLTPGPLCIEAPAGSGKTSVLTRRIAYRVANEGLDPRRVLVVTFTRRAAAELGERLRALGLRDTVTAGTFHGIAYQQLRSLWSDRGTQPPMLLERKHQLIQSLLPAGTPVETSDVVGEIEWAKARGVRPSGYEAEANAEGRRPPVAAEFVTEVYRRYEATKGERRLVDFDDLLSLCRRALVDDREFAAAQHWRFRHVFVDEFQDVNPLQFSLLRAWLPAEPDLCVVGDPNQAIYGWNGADSHLMARFTEHFPGGTTVALDRNYRSSPQILSVASAALAAEGSPTPPVVAVRGDEEIPEIHHYPTDVEEADGIARRARDLRLPGEPWRAQAVLVRTNAQAPVITAALDRAGVPSRVRAGGEQLGTSDAVEIVTFHGAKGLEWPVVHVAGLERGLVPVAHAQTSDARDEERRLLYVALTRAERLLVCSWAAERTFGSSPTSRQASPWLTALQGAVDGLDEGPARDWRHYLIEGRAHLVP